MASSPQTPIQIHIPPTLQKYTKSLAQYLAANPQYNNLVVSAFIFDNQSPSTSSDTGKTPRLLILCRAAHEFSFANLWEVPGGSSDATDPTLLHSLAREVFEETGLKLTRFVRQVGDVVEFQTGKGMRRKNWAKINFEIEVAEVDSHGSEGSHLASAGVLETGAGSQGKNPEVADGSGAGDASVVVTIDPKEHQSYAWATAEEVAAGKYLIATTEQKELMLRAFQARQNVEGDAV